MKKISKFTLLLACALMVFVLAGCGKKPTSIEVNNYIDVEFSGYDSLGQIASYEFEARKMLNDYEKELKEVSKKDLQKLFEEKYTFTAKDLTHLKNGESIRVKWDVDEDKLAEFEEEHNVKFIYDNFDITVSDLEEMEKVDIFNGVTVEFSGIDESGSAWINNNSSYSLQYKMDKSDSLSNGDTITVTAYPYYDNEIDISEYMADYYQKLPQTTTKTFTVSGLSTRIKNLSQIPDALLKEMEKATKDKLVESTKNWSYPDSFQGATFMGYLLITDDRNRSWLDVVYKVDVDSARDGAMAYYTFGQYRDLVLDGDGKLNKDISSVNITSNNFYYNDYWYYGYQEYDKILESVSNENYNVENKVDTSIITKVTHTPKDFSVVTATPEFSADCFAYRLQEGSYVVTGFTQKGYDLIHTYKANDCISITLPATTDSGDTVEGFYSTYNEDGNYTMYNAFEDDNAPLYVLVCPDSYTKFYGFYDYKANYKLRNIVLGKDINMISKQAFRGCTGITKITLPDGLDEIPDRAFEGCTLLSEVVIPQSVTKIGEDAFKNCANLEKATIPEKIMEIGKAAFYNCAKLTIPTLEISGKKIGAHAFYEANIGTLTFTENGYTSERYTSWGDVYATWNKAHVQKIVIGDGIVLIPDYAFEYCADVKEIVIPEGVTEIGVNAFAYCTSLETVTLPESLKKISANAFLNCTSLKTINIPDSVMILGEYAFKGCSALAIDSFDMTGKTIEREVFNGVTIKKLSLTGEDYTSTFYKDWSTPMAPWNGAYVKEIELGPDVKRIPDYAFAYCSGLAEVVLPDTVIEIGKEAFSHCQSLKSITINEGVTAISDNAFNECTSLKSAVIPASCLYIGNNAFRNCSSLMIESFDFTNRTLGTDAFSEATINELKLSGNSFETLRYNSWGTIYTPWRNVTVKNVVIEEGVTEIPAYAFEYITSVAEITVPSTVTKIGKEAFGNCTSLRKLHLPAGLASIDSSALLNSKDLVIYAPEGSVGQTFASKNGFFFTAETPVDANGEASTETTESAEATDPATEEN